MDKAQTIAFVNYMIGFKTIGVAGDEEIRVPYSPELLAFIVGRLGDDLPLTAYNMVHYGTAQHRHKADAQAFAAFLREAADVLAPPETAP